MKLKTLLLGLSIVLFYSIGFSQKKAKTIKQKQATQNKRITQGTASGELTKKETVQLRHQQHQIRKTKKAAKADGIVTKKERAIIHNKQNKANKNIVRKKHNKLKRK